MQKGWLRASCCLLPPAVGCLPAFECAAVCLPSSMGASPARTARPTAFFRKELCSLVPQEA